MLLLQAPNRIQEVRIGTSNSGSANQRLESSLPSQSRVVFVVSGGRIWSMGWVPRFSMGRRQILLPRRPAELVVFTLIFGALGCAPTASRESLAPTRRNRRCPRGRRSRCRR
jgi:hypothetical protein